MKTEELKKQHIPRKKWPDKPTRPRKKSWQEFLPISNNESEAEEEDEDDNDYVEEFSWYQE